MEDGLGAYEPTTNKTIDKIVLILVLVEDGLGVSITNIDNIIDGGVLILVLVEDGLGVEKIHHLQKTIPQS